MKLAIFDFDGTIYKHETFTLLMKHLKNHPEYNGKYNAFYRSIIPPYTAYKMRLYSESSMKATLMQKYLHIFKGKTALEVFQFFEGLAPSLQNDFHPIVIERLQAHKQNGYYIMVVSGAYTPLLKTVLEYLPIDTIIGTEIPFTDGVYDPSKHIDHVQATRKTELINQAMKDLDICWEDSFAYGQLCRFPCPQHGR